MESEPRKQIIGEAIYHTLHPKLQDKTGKITGMLLTMEWNNMYGALTNVNQFNLRVSEALATYEQHLSRENA